jgi:hypothetical protein
MAKSKQAKKTGQAPKSGSQANKPGPSTKPGSKASGPVKKQVKKERGGLLTFLLVLIMLHAIFATYLAYTYLKAEYDPQRPLILTGLLLISLADIVAAVGMWYWKKWGIYLYAVTRVAATAIHLMLTGSLLVVFYDLLPVAILGYVINLQSKRHLFE